MSTTVDRARIPKELAARYELIRVLGTGGAGIVWLARHRAVGTLVAIKTTVSPSAKNARAIERERRAVARLSHPHIVSTFDMAPDCIVMAYVDGPDVAKRLAHGSIMRANAVSWSLQVASALSYAHERGIVHRDVKPSNILVDARGNAFLSDFGAAHFLDEMAEPAGRVGTPGFMPKEQAEGGKVTFAADQFALARSLLDMLVGRHVVAVDGELFDAALSTLPDALAACILRATMEPPELRFASVRAFADALSRAAVEPRPPVPERGPCVRPRGDFRWATSGAAKPAMLDIASADYRLGEVEATGGLSREAVRAFRAASGYAELKWSLFGNATELGPACSAEAVARTSRVVVLMHGTPGAGDEWDPLSAAIVRDFPSTLVLAPDLHGEGSSRFRDDVTPEQVSPLGAARTVLALLRLLGIGTLSRVLVGHSYSALGLACLSEREVGEEAERVLVAPIFPFIGPQRDRTIKRIETWLRVFHTLPPLAQEAAFRLVAAGRRRIARINDDLTTEVFEKHLAITRANTIPNELAKLVGFTTACPPAGERLRRGRLVFGAGDPSIDHATPAEIAEHLAIPASRVHFVVTGGHYLHLPHAQHPEWGAHNRAEILRAISLSIEALGASPDATVDATVG